MNAPPWSAQTELAAGASHVVIPAGEGWSFWQPQPAQGYVTVQLTPANMPYDHFSAGVQMLPPGCSVREHGHQRNHELVHVTAGTGICTIDGTTYELKPGATVLFGRNARHTILNTGEEPMLFFWVFMPPGLENWFHAIGQPRTPGEPQPPPFPRPPGLEDAMAAQHFLPPKPEPSQP
jgi:quercetin dioxygenase-like cupin family protein